MKNTYRKQRGLTFISWMVVVALIGFGALLVLKLYPPYYGYFKVNTAMKSLRSEGDSAMSDREIKQHLLRRFQIDDVDEVNEKHIVIRKTAAGKEVQVAYEVRVPIVGNLDAVARFDKTVELGGS